MSKRELSNKMRVIHRYLGFFLAGIMAVYAISGVTLIFRDSDVLKKKYTFEKTIDKGISKSALGRALDVRRLIVTEEKDGVFYFKEGTYNPTTGEARYSKVEFPPAIKKLQHLHKAKTSDPLYYLNIFFGLSLLFFVISSFWMFMPGSTVFKKGMYFTAAGVALTLLLLFL